MNVMALIVALSTTTAIAGSADSALREEALPKELSEYVERCDAMGMQLWRQSLCTPVVIVNPQTNTFIATQPAPEPLPALRANTSFMWGGETWVMALQPLPDAAEERAALFYHESFHAHQEALGLPSNGAVASHLSDVDARIAMRLEWNALAAALTTTSTERDQHIQQALALRAKRVGTDPARATAERELMRHEGLAAYTGAALSGAPERVALRALERGSQESSLARSFAYASGPAWGLLLDAKRPDWKAALRSGVDLPDLMPLMPASHIKLAHYGADAIIREERERFARMQAKRDSAMAMTSEDRSIGLPLAAMQMDFDPNRVESAADGSTLYWKISLRDSWGVLSVDGSAILISKDYRSARVPWPLPADARLEVNPLWRVVRVGGKLTLVRAVSAPKEEQQ